METKVCSKCGEEKALSSFVRDKEKKDGYKSQCKKCCYERTNQWRKHNKKRIHQYREKYYADNKESLDKYTKNYYYANRSSVTAYYRRYHRSRRDNDPLFRIRAHLRSRMYQLLRCKSENTEHILGCSFEEFKEHIEKQFTEGMNWDNHGEWHLDHIIPLASAITEEEVIKLNHYTNFQPLWAFDNLSKGSLMYI